MLIFTLALGVLAMLPAIFASSPKHPLARRWQVDSVPAERPAMFCDLPAHDQANFGPSDDDDRPLYDDCWNLGIEFSVNPSKLTVGDWAGTNGCGKIGTNGTCGVCVGRTDDKDDEVVFGSEDVGNALMPVAKLYHDGNYTGGTAKMACPDSDAKLLWKVRHVKYMSRE